MNCAAPLGAAFLFLILLSTFSAPFGIATLPFAERLVFWTVLALSSALIVVASCMTIGRHAAGLHDRIRDLLLLAMMTALFVPVLWGLLGVLRSAGNGPGPSLAQTLQYGGLFSVGLLLAGRGLPAVDAALMPSPAPPRPRLLRRLPEGFSGQVLRLTVRDHFVDVVTTEGEHTIRLRFGDAIDEMEPVTGYCTHRSHWVTRDAIAGVEREAGKQFLRLINGDLVPVSRKYRPGLEDAGIV